MRTSLCVATLGSMMLAAPGCGGGDGLPREPIAGTVTLDGRPLTTGMITFTPTEEEGPVVTGILAEDGSFSLARADGPVPGPHRVTLWSQRPTGKKVRSPDDPEQLVDEVRDVVPDRYRLDSPLTAEVEQGGDNTFAFEITGETLAKGKRR
jgi:hypothetical protein